MPKHINGSLCFDKEESVRLIDMLLHPDREAIAKRDKLISRIKSRTKINNGWIVEFDDNEGTE